MKIRGWYSFNPRTARKKGLVAYGQTLVSTLLCACRAGKSGSLHKRPLNVSRETKSALLWNKSVSRETSALCVRNIDRQRNSILVFLPVYGCTDSGVHHYADRPIERIQEKPHVLNKPHNIILMRRLR